MILSIMNSLPRVPTLLPMYLLPPIQTLPPSKPLTKNPKPSTNKPHFVTQHTFSKIQIPHHLHIIQCLPLHIVLLLRTLLLPVIYGHGIDSSSYFPPYCPHLIVGSFLTKLQFPRRGFQPRRRSARKQNLLFPWAGHEFARWTLENEDHESQASFRSLHSEVHSIVLYIDFAASLPCNPMNYVYKNAPSKVQDQSNSISPNSILCNKNIIPET